MGVCTGEAICGSGGSYLWESVWKKFSLEVCVEEIICESLCGGSSLCESVWRKLSVEVCVEEVICESLT